MAVSKKIKAALEEGSWIRKMFELGEQLRRQGEGVTLYDFTLGNPNLEPPEIFYDTLREIAELRVPQKHGYMSNAGYRDVRAAVAERINKVHETNLTAEEVIMACGAGGAMNIVLKTILDPGDSVLVSVPCFMEYRFYTENHCGKLIQIPCKEGFDLDLTALESAIDYSTAAVIINSPNNPSGYIYPEETIKALGELLSRKSREIERVIYLVSDEPYRKIVYNGDLIPSVFAWYKNSIIVTSYSKELSIPGERIGWAAVNPLAEDRESLIAGMVLSNRILGFINAPAFMQRVIGKIGDISVPVEEYRKRRDILCNALKEYGYDFILPKGTFYCFPKAPGGDDIAFVEELQKECILTVPGRGFGLPGYFRIAFCVDEEVIRQALPGFRRAFQRIESRTHPEALKTHV